MLTQVNNFLSNQKSNQDVLENVDLILKLVFWYSVSGNKY